MKSKIEIGKLGALGKVLGNDEFAWVLRELNIIIEKQNEVIDYLNSQSQPDEDYKKKVKDTPEEWKKELGDLVEKIDIKKTPSEKDWLDKEYKRATKDVLVAFVQQLLDDRDKRIEELEDKLYDMRCERDEED